ncbi:hypothetical protein [Micromonospora sp. NPDC092111]|uniref:hypothetical protein n=1 Tax=Micromonospora sp. NPDC092111 TaxID=3364289 RepID=UPI00380669D7
MFEKNRLTPSTLGRRTASRTAVCAVAAGAAVFAFPSASWAYDNYFDWCSRGIVSCQTGAAVGTPGDVDKCVQELTHYTVVCIKYAGDIVYVWDGSSDGNSAMGSVSTPDAGDVSGRWCRNLHGAGTWAKCNFDWVEDTKKWVYGGVRYDSSSEWHTLLWTFSSN